MVINSDVWLNPSSHFNRCLVGVVVVDDDDDDDGDDDDHWCWCSEMTLNVSLGVDFTGGEVEFCGIRGCEDENRVRLKYPPTLGRAVLHCGKSIAASLTPATERISCTDNVNGAQGDTSIKWQMSQVGEDLH